MQKSTLALRFGAALLAAVCAVPADARADAVRVLAPGSDGAPEETTLEGKIESTSADKIVLAVDGQKRTLAAASVLGTQYDDEPVALAAVRADLELGQYEDALAKLAEISAADVRSARAEVAAEIESLRALATGRLALAGSEKLATGGRAVLAFVQKSPTHWRHYEAVELLGEILAKTGKPAEAEERFAALEKAASPIVRARGKIARGTLALADAARLADAEKLFADALAELDAADGNAPETNAARVFAQIGAARVLAGQKRFDDAEKTLDAAIAATPRDALATQAAIYVAQGAIRVAAGRPRDAIVSYVRVELLYPSVRERRVEALKALVPLWTQTGRPDRAADVRRTLKERFKIDVDAAAK